MGDVRCPTGNAFGSIAYSESTGKTGKAANYCVRSSADRKAVADCGKKDCQVEVWLDNNCGALAAGKGAWAYAVGDEKDDVEALAVQQYIAKVASPKSPEVAPDSGAAPPDDKTLAAGKTSKTAKKGKRAKPKPAEKPCKVVASMCSRSGE